MSDNRNLKQLVRKIINVMPDELAMMNWCA